MRAVVVDEAEARVSTGVVIVGEVPNTSAPVPVVVTAEPTRSNTVFSPYSRLLIRLLTFDHVVVTESKVPTQPELVAGEVPRAVSTATTSSWSEFTCSAMTTSVKSILVLKDFTLDG